MILTYKMATHIWKLCGANINNKVIPNFGQFLRNGHHMRGKPPGVARSLKQRLEELNYKDPELHFKVNIGLPSGKKSRTKDLDSRLANLKVNRNDKELEKKARNQTLLIDLEESRKVWTQTIGPEHIKTIGEHYGVFQDLFGDAYFTPRVPMNVFYEQESATIPVYFGNFVKPSEAVKKPQVDYESNETTLWTLIMTNPDGNFTQQDKEYVHWFVGNIPGNKIDQGETLVNYLQPFPPRGTGYHRHIFILYKQEKKIDYSKFKKDGACLTLSERTFSTLDFYRNLQDVLTPAGLSFFQSDWDKSLTDFFHKTLDMKEPVYEYDFPETYVKPQEWFPLREAFNLYMDRYRDPKQINKEFLERKLKHVHPFKPPQPPLPYPNAVRFEENTPSWLKLEKTKARNKWGRINDV